MLMMAWFIEFSHLAWINTPRKQGGLGEMNIPILSDKTKQVARDYGVLLEDAGVTLRGTLRAFKTRVKRETETLNIVPSS